NQWSGGPNGTPTVDKDMIYVLGSAGDLVCFSTKSGKGEEVWRKNMVKDFGGEGTDIFSGQKNMGRGYCWSPLGERGHPIITPGGQKGLFAALNKKSGETIWQSKDAPEPTTYASPVVAEIKGVKQYVAVLQDGCVGVDPKNGNVLWRYKRPQPFADIVA